MSSNSSNKSPMYKAKLEMFGTRLKLAEQARYFNLKTEDGHDLGKVFRQQILKHIAIIVCPEDICGRENNDTKIDTASEKRKIAILNLRHNELVSRMCFTLPATIRQLVEEEMEVLQQEMNGVFKDFEIFEEKKEGNSSGKSAEKPSAKRSSSVVDLTGREEEHEGDDDENLGEASLSHLRQSANQNRRIKRKTHARADANRLHVDDDSNDGEKIIGT